MEDGHKLMEGRKEGRTGHIYLIEPGAGHKLYHYIFLQEKESISIICSNIESGFHTLYQP